MRYKAADEIGAARRGHIRRGLLHVRAARVGMNERQHRLHALDPARVPTGQIRSGIGGRREYAEIFCGQRRGHHHCRGLVEDLAGRRTNP